MPDELTTYAQKVLSVLLRLQQGEALSINTEESDFGFARLIAIKACEMTGVPARIVVTVNGRPSDVVDIDPEGSAGQITSRVLLRLEHVSDRELPAGYSETDVEPDDFPTLKRMGHLAEPIELNRRIALPWCVVPANIDMSAMIDSDKVLAADYRRRYLNSLDLASLSLDGDGTSLLLSFPVLSRFTGGTQKLTSGRSFLSSVDYDRLYRIVDCQTAEGRVRAWAVILGKRESLELEFRDGCLSGAGGSRTLSRFLEFDKLLGRAGYISMRDREFCLFLGGSVTDGLLEAYEDEDKIPSFFNKSPYSLRLELDPHIDINGISRNLKTTELVRRGFFLE